MTPAIFTNHASAQQGGVNFGVFYNELSPYGQWVDYPNYGYVWIPSAESDFAPYSSNGYWIFTDYGWTWVSNYSWGWAPFHYGRWDYDDFYGWFWVPDNEWGPSWVNWRRANGYYGWAPMRPGISISVSFGGGYTVPNDRWRFVRDRDFSRPDINHYYINRTKNSMIIKNSSVINRTYTDQNRHSTYVSGPDRADVQKITGRSIQPVVIQDNEKPGQNLRNGQLQIYRPQVQKNDENGPRPAPSRVVNLKDVKRPSERNAANPIPNVTPANTTRQKEQPAQPSKVTPAIINRQKDQPAQPTNVTPVNTNRPKEQPARPTKVTPVNTNRPKEQQTRPTKVTPVNTNRPKEQQTRPTNVIPVNTSRQKEQPVRTTKVTPVKINRQKVQPAQPSNVKPANTNRPKEQPSRSVNPQNTQRDTKPDHSQGEQKK